MLKHIATFYRILSVLSVIGTIIIMANSINPLVVFISGLLSALVLMSIAAILLEVDTHFKYQDKAIKWLVKSRRNGRRN